MRVKYCSLVMLLMVCFQSLYSQEQKTSQQRLIERAKDTAGINELLNFGIDLINVDNTKAREVFNITLKNSLHIGYDYGIGSSYARLGYLEGHKGRNREGIAYAQKAVVHYERINRTSGIVLCYINIGYNFDILGLADSALHYLLKGIQLLENTQTQPGKLARLYENVGNVFANRKEFSKAILYSRKAVELSTFVNDSDYIVTAHTGLCNALLQGKDYMAGLEAAKMAKRYLPHREDRSLIIKVYLHLASAYSKLNEPDSAIAAAKKSMQYSANFDPANFIAAGLDLADAYEQKKDHRNEKIVLDTLKRQAEADTSLFHLFSIYERMAHLNYLTGNYKDAYEYSAKYNAYKDSFYLQENTKEIAEVESRFQWAQKEKALSEKQLQLTKKDLALQKSNQNVLYAIAGLLVMLLLATVFFIQGRNRKKSFSLKFDALQKQQEIEMLKASMQGEEQERSRIAKDLHDGIAGMLAAAKMHLCSAVYQQQHIVESKDYKQSIKLLDEITGEVRKTSHNLMPEVLLQHGLDEALRRYCRNIGSGALPIQYDSWGEMERFNNSFELSVYRIVQELLNNIIKHSQANEAIVQLSYRDNILSITVEDNGVGYDTGETVTTGMGLHSLASRLKALNGKMQTDSKPGEGVSIYLEFDISRTIIQPVKENKV